MVISASDASRAAGAFSLLAKAVIHAIIGEDLTMGMGGITLTWAASYSLKKSTLSGFHKPPSWMM
jgi:hypothetical protein